MVGRKENRLESAHSCIHICVLLVLCGVEAETAQGTRVEE